MLVNVDMSWLELLLFYEVKMELINKIQIYCL